jgi:hypothetical protein
MDSLRERPPCSSARGGAFSCLGRKGEHALYDWIIEADIHRLKKALADAQNERGRLEILIKSKQRKLAQNRDSLFA